MADARLKTGIWVSSALRMANIAGRSGAVLRRGDADAGGVLIVLRRRDGLRVLTQARGADGEMGWLRGTGVSPVDQDAADAYIARQVDRDPDLWVVEVDSPDGLPPFPATFL